MNWEAVGAIAELLGAIAANLRHPGIRSCWAETRPIYADDFELVIEQLLRETPAVPDAPDRPIAVEHTT